MVISEVAEKRRISNHANIGAYYFSKFGYFLDALKRSKEKGAKTNDEYYVAPLYNELIADGKRVVARECDTVWSLGTPDLVETFESKFLSM